jgi:hypothetical protein
MDKSKIICFVDNRKKSNGEFDDSQGLYIVFEEKTPLGENAFFKTFIANRDENGNWHRILGEDGKNILLFSKEKGVRYVSEINADDNWNMLWVHDSISVNNLLKQIKNLSPDTLLLYHSKPVNAEAEAEELCKAGKIKIHKKGQHGKDNNQHYIHLYNIIQIWQKDDANPNGKFDSTEFDKVFKEIYDKIFPNKLESILTFLHDYHDNLKTPDSADYSILEKAEIDVSDLRILKGREIYSEEWVTSLSILRDKLLENA